jgi:hypothetical protein
MSSFEFTQCLKKLVANLATLPAGEVLATGKDFGSTVCYAELIVYESLYLSVCLTTYLGYLDDI